MEIFGQILAYGYLIVVGFIFAIILIQLFAYYIAGRVTGSINDEFTTAFTLFGAMLVIGAASTLVNAALSTFLNGFLLPAAISSFVYLIIIIIAIAKIYELSAGKAILHLILSFILTAVLAGALIYAAIMVLPEKKVETNPGEDTHTSMEMEEKSFMLDEEKDEVMDELADEVVDEDTEVETPQNGGVIEGVMDSVTELEDTLSDAEENIEDAIAETTQ